MQSLENFDGLGRYLRKEIHSVAGYLTTADALAISSLGRFQTERGIKGGLCEFGVHHGRLFFILANLRRQGEKSLAVDLFEDGEGNANKIHRGRDTAMFQNARRLGIDLGEDEILVGNTLELRADNILTRIGKPRLISVDAGHLYDEVKNDLNLSAEILADDGIIIADDYFNIYWPDVTTATNDFLQKQAGKFVPFLITPGKLYICRADRRPVYEEFNRRFTGSRDLRSRTVELTKLSLTAVRLSRRGTFRHRVRALLSGKRLNSVT